MKMLHTSDWHIGRRFHGADLLTEQKEFMRHISAIVHEHKIDLVVISGDIYDRALPPAPAVTALDEGLNTILAAGAQILLSAGNHDSASRLGFGAARSAAAGLHIRCSLDHIDTPWLHQEGNNTFGVYAINYLDPTLMAGHLDVKATHHDVLHAACQRITQDADRRQLDHVTVSAHAFVTGATSSDSERDISVGGVEQVAVEIFAPFDYVALGHLHRAATITPNIRYSGSPLPYSFSEADHTKGFWLLDLAPGEPVVAEFINTEPAMALSRITGTMHDVLYNPEHTTAENTWCEITITDIVRPPDIMQKVRTRFPQAVSVRHTPPETQHDDATSYAHRVQGADDFTLCERFVEHVRQLPLSDTERQLVATGWEHVNRQDPS